MCIFMPCVFCMSARKELKMNEKEPIVLNSEVEMSKTLQIRNSTIDFLVFTKQNSQDSIEVRVQDENVWLTQDGISRLFDVDRSVVTKHLKNVFETNELEEISVCAKFAHTAADGKTYKTKFYNLDAIISVGYRVNSIRATQFRQWATNVLRNFAIKGYVLDKQRLENGQIFDEEYFENLLEEIREIRMSERKFYECRLQPGCRHDKGFFRKCAEQVALGYPPAYRSRTHYGTCRCEKDAHGFDDLAQGT